MTALLADARDAGAHALAMLRARPGLVLLFVAVQLVSNLLRLWIGAPGDGGNASRVFVWAVGGIFLFARVFVTQWLHVAAARLADDARVPLRAAFRVAPGQAAWFHLLVLVSIAAFGVRLWLGQLAGGFFAPIGIAGVSAVAGLALGLFVTYLLFLPLTPGYYTALLDDWAPGVRWSLAGVRGQLGRALAVVMLLVMPPAVLRLWVFALLGKGGYALVFATAAADAALTVLLMLLATAVYWRTYRRALGADRAAAGASGRGDGMTRLGPRRAFAATSPGRPARAVAAEWRGRRGMLPKARSDSDDSGTSAA